MIGIYKLHEIPNKVTKTKKTENTKRKLHKRKELTPKLAGFLLL